MPIPDQFSTRRLRARRATASDIGYVHAVDTDPRIYEWLSGTASTRDESEARLARWVDEQRRSGLGFYLFSLNGIIIGHGGLFTSVRDPGSVEMGYAVLPPYWGAGYGTEMAQALYTIARDGGVHHVAALTRRSNERSQRVLQKCGFRFDGEVTSCGVTYARYLPPESGGE